MKHRVEKTRLPFIDFTKAQRLDTGGVILQGLASFGKLLRTLGLAVLYFAVKHPEFFLRWQFWMGLIVVFVVQMVFSYLQHRNFTYYVDEHKGEFLIQQGVFNKSTTVIKFENILQVNIRQNMIQQALDLYGFEIESAGSKDKEADLYALNEPTALALKEYLAQKHLGQIQVENSTSDEEETIFNIPNKNILAVSLFSNYSQGFGLFIAFVVTTFDRTIGFRNLPDFDGFEVFTANLQENWFGMLYQIVLIGLIILLIPIVINLFKYLVTYYNFTLNKNTSGNLLMHFGLFQLKDIILNRNKVQMIHITDNPILRRMGLGVLSLHQITVDSSKPESTTIRMPGINRIGRTKLWDVLFKQDIYQNVQVLRPKIGLLVNRLVKSTFILGSIILYLYVINSSSIIIATAWTITALVWVYNYIYYRNYKFLLGKNFLIRRSGVWDISDQIVPVNRILTVQVSQNFLQKQFNTANLTGSTSSGMFTFRFFALKDVQQISDIVLYLLSVKTTYEIKTEVQRDI